MGTIKELDDGVIRSILFYIVEHKIEGKAIDMLLEHVSKSSKKFVRDFLKNVL